MRCSCCGRRSSQSRHDFEARSRTSTGCWRAPAHAQAWLSKATILAVQGEPQEALGSCALLGWPLDAIEPASAPAADGRRGRHATLRGCWTRSSRRPGAGARDPGLDPHRAGRDRRALGDAAAAESALPSRARASTPRSLSARRLRRLPARSGPAAEVPALLVGETAATPCCSASRSPSSSSARRRRASTSTLRRRASRPRAARRRRASARGGALRAAPARTSRSEALELAQENWAMQREPADARIVLEAALAAGDAAERAAGARLARRNRPRGRRGSRALGRSSRSAADDARCSLAAGAGAVLAPRPRAHKPSDSYLTLTRRRAAARGRWDIALRDLDHAIGLDGDGDGAITWGEVRARQARIAAYALARLELDRRRRALARPPDRHLVDRAQRRRLRRAALRRRLPGAADAAGRALRLAVRPRSAASRLAAGWPPPVHAHARFSAEQPASELPRGEPAPGASSSRLTCATASGTSGSASITSCSCSRCCCRPCCAGRTGWRSRRAARRVLEHRSRW